jgi:hypothetical protein
VGNVGVGTNDTTHRLTVAAPDQETMRLLNSTTGFGEGARLNFGDEDYVFIEEDVDDALQIQANRISLMGGNVGIGSSNPASRLEIVGQDALSMIGYQPLLTFQDSNAGYARSRIQGVNGDISLTTEAYIGSGGANPGAGLLLLKNGSGNVGIGTTTPTSKLEIAAQDGLAITGFQPFLTLRDTNAGGARSIIAGGNGDFGFYPNSFIGGAPPVMIKNQTGNLVVSGDATQARDKGGFVKAMAKVNADGSIARQYSASGGNITASYDASYYITFPFQVNDRYVSVTPLVNFSVFAVTASVGFNGPNTATVTIYDPRDTGADDPAVANEFFIFVLQLIAEIARSSGTYQSSGMRKKWRINPLKMAGTVPTDFDNRFGVVSVVGSLLRASSRLTANQNFSRLLRPSRRESCT